MFAGILAWFPMVTLPVNASATVLVVNSQPAVTIVVDADAPEWTLRAVENLTYYVREISGGELPVVNDPQEVETSAILWVGKHPALSARYSSVNFDVKNPEEILIEVLGKDIVILGRDVVSPDGVQLEAGTHLAISSFIENQLGVRWFWPGKWGTDIPKQETIRIGAVSVRYTPQLRVRSLSLPNFESGYNSLSKRTIRGLSGVMENSKTWVREKDLATREWLNHHRGDARSTGSSFIYPLAGSWSAHRTAGTHGFKGWFAKYREVHPDWFAMQPDGTRQEGSSNPYPNVANVKMCVSNPEVAEQWVKDAVEYFKKNPHATDYNAGERDYGWQGYCLCEGCLAMDNQEAEMLEQPVRWENESRELYALTDRYVKFWNIIAKRLKEELPDREVYVGVSPYHVTRPAPTIRMEENIIPVFVGLEGRFYNRNHQEYTEEQREMWRGWWEAAGRKNKLMWRPNIMYLNLSLPYVFTRRHAENMRFMADHGLAGVVTSSGMAAGSWATQGPQLYLSAKLLWDPRADVTAVMDDYYERAYGPASIYIQQYFQLYEDLYTRLAEQYKGQGFSTYQDPPRLFREIRLDSRPAQGRLGKEGITPHRAIEEQAGALLQQAMSAVANSEEKFQERVAFVKTGFDFIQAQLDSIEAMNHFREKATEENRNRLVEAVARRTAILEANLDNFAFNYISLLNLFERRPQDLGDPSIVAPVKESEEEQQQLQDDLEA